MLYLIAAVVLQTGCGHETTRPVVTAVGLEVTVTPEVGDPSAPISIRVLVKNEGTTSVLHCSGCGCGSGIRVLGPDGNDVLLHDPKAVGPMCPDGFEPLYPMESLVAGDSFTGVLYERDAVTFPTPTYAAAPGTYTVIAVFGYKPSMSEEWIPLERSVTFVWNP